MGKTKTGKKRGRPKGSKNRDTARRQTMQVPPPVVTLPVPEKAEDDAPVPRQRGDGPTCEVCGSGMTCNRSDPEMRLETGRPAFMAGYPGVNEVPTGRKIRYYKCNKAGCAGRTKTVK